MFSFSRTLWIIYIWQRLCALVISLFSSCDRKSFSRALLVLRYYHHYFHYYRRLLCWLSRICKMRAVQCMYSSSYSFCCNNCIPYTLPAEHRSFIFGQYQWFTDSGWSRFTTTSWRGIFRDDVMRCCTLHRTVGTSKSYVQYMYSTVQYESKNDVSSLLFIQSTVA
jgi:hypothetical protein